MEELLDAGEALTALRRDLRILLVTIQKNAFEFYPRFKGEKQDACKRAVQILACELDKLLRRHYTPAWRNLWKCERHLRLSAIAGVQVRDDTPCINLIPEPKTPQEFEEQIANEEGLDELKKVNDREKLIVRKIGTCDLATEKGRKTHAAMTAELEKIKVRSAELWIAILGAWALRLEEAKPTGRPLRNWHFLMVTRKDSDNRAVVYDVDAPSIDCARKQIEEKSGRSVVAVYTDPKSAAFDGMDWQAARRFTVTVYESGEIECDPHLKAE